MKFLNQQPLESFENDRSIYIDTATSTLGVGGKIALFKNNNIASFRTNIQASTSLAADYTLTLPPTPGTAGQVLMTDGTGTLSYATISGTGTVTSVSGTGTVSGLSLSGTVTTSGDLTLSGTLEVVPSNFDVQTANKVLVGPASGSDATPTFRTLVAADIPSLSYQPPLNVTGILKSNGTSGNVSAASAGTDYAAPDQTMYLGTTAIALNRASATGLSLAGVSVDGSAGSVAAANLTGATLASGVTGSSLTSVGTLNGVTVGGDITITGTARRITGDFSNATVANRVAFQSSTTDTNTILTVYPNGTATTTGINFYSTPDPLNANLAQLSVINTEVRIQANALGTSSYIPMTFYTGGSESVRIGGTAGTDKGTVGIGYNSLTNVGVNGLAVAGKVGAGTNAPTNILEVQETGTGTGNGGLTVSTATTGGNAGIRFKTASTENWQITTAGVSGSVALRFYDIVNSAERMRIDANGNVGIGTTSTSLNALNVVAKANTNYAMFDAPTSGYAYVSLKYNGTFYGYFGQGNGVFTGGINNDFGIRAENSLVFGIGTTEKMRLHSNGYVGIGNTAPSGLLTLGAASGTNGNIVLNGSTSGSVTIKTAVVAGTWSMTLPVDAGSDGYLLKTDGNGVTSWVGVGSGGTTYIGTTSLSLTRTSANQALTGIISVAFPGSTSGTATLQATAIAGTTTISLPTATGTLVGTGDSGTVTNTMLANSSFYIGTTSISLGRASANLALTGITSIDGSAVSAGKATNLVGGNNTTLLGSIPYQSNTDTTTLLGPNTTTTKKFLRMTGNGTNGTPPSWDTIAASDVPTLNQNTSGSAGSVANILTIGSGLSGTSFNGSAAVTIAIDSTVALRADTHYIGTTSVALNRSSANLALTGITSITGGSSVSQSLTLQSTSGIGTSDSILFKVGNNGATTAMTIDTSGNVSITGAISASNINRTYALPAVGGSASWIKLGTYVGGQGGHHCFIKVVTTVGYNAATAQQNEIYIHFLTSNGVSVDANGFAGFTQFYITNTAGISYNVKVVGNAAGISATSYDIWFYQAGAYNGNGSFYTVEINNTVATWTNIATTGSDPGVASATIGVGTNGYSIQSSVSISASLGIGNSGDNNTRVLNFNTSSGGSSSIQSVTVGATNQALTFSTTYTTLSERMRITGDGNVGIGTSTINSRLDVRNGSSYTGPSSGSWLTRLVQNSNVSGGNGLSVSNAWATSDSIIFEAAMGWNGSTTGYYPVFTIDGIGQAIWQSNVGSQRMKIDSSGNVGIGTSSPQALLDLYSSGSTTLRLSGGSGGGASVSQIDFFRIGSNVTSSIVAIRDASNSSGALTFYTATSGTNSERMRIDSSGNVGIGTTAPANPLQVVGAIRAGAGPTDATNASITMYNDGTGASIEAFQGNNATVKRNLWLNAYGGNVGVGTSSPGEKLTISGNTSSDVYKLRSNTSVPSSTDAFIYRPADNTIAFGTASTERVRIQSDGLTTTNAIAAVGSSGLPAQVSGNAVWVGGYASPTSGRLFIGDGTGWIYYMSKRISSTTTDLFTFTDGGNFTATGNITAYSDIKLKTNITTIDNALDKVSRMRGVMFTRKDTGAKGTGVIAQEIKEVLPEVVLEGETLSVAYGNIVGVLIEAIKELKAEIEQLKGNK